MSKVLLTPKEIEVVFRGKAIFASSPEMRREAEASLVAQAQLAKVKAEIEKIENPYKISWQNEMETAKALGHNRAKEDILKLLEE